MNAKLKERLDLFEKNNRILKKKYWLKDINLQILSGFIYSCSGREADIALLDECRGILRNRFGAFSSARDMLELPLMVSMAVSGSPETYVSKLAAAYEQVRKGTVFSGSFEMLAAAVLMDTPQYRLPETAEKMKRIYKKMRRNHPLLTGSSDKSAAALLTLCGREEDAVLEEMETCFRLLKEKLKGRNDAVQAMSAFLAVQEGTAEVKCAKTLEYCGKLKAAGMNLKTSMLLPVVAALSVLDCPADDVVREVKEAAGELKGKTGFGFFGAGKNGRTVYAIMNYLACADEMGGAAGSMLQNEVLNMVITELIVLLMLISSSQAAAASSGS